MTLLALSGGPGAPGVTTAALALLLGWPVQPGRRVLLVECDPDGGAVLAGALQGQVEADRGLHRLAVADRRGRLAESLGEQLVDLGPEGGPERLLLPGLTDPAQAAALAYTWEPLARVCRELADGDCDVIVDLGRGGAFGPSAVLARRADVVLAVTRCTLRGISATRPRAEALRADLDARGTGSDALGLLLVQEGPYATAEISRTLNLPVLGLLPHAPREARILSDGGDLTDRRLHRSELLRSARSAADQVHLLASRRHTRLAPPPTARGPVPAPVPPLPRSAPHATAPAVPGIGVADAAPQLGTSARSDAAAPSARREDGRSPGSAASAASVDWAAPSAPLPGTSARPDAAAPSAWREDGRSPGSAASAAPVDWAAPRAPRPGTSAGPDAASPPAWVVADGLPGSATPAEAPVAPTASTALTVPTAPLLGTAASPDAVAPSAWTAGGRSPGSAAAAAASASGQPGGAARQASASDAGVSVPPTVAQPGPLPEFGSEGGWASCGTSPGAPGPGGAWEADDRPLPPPGFGVGAPPDDGTSTAVPAGWDTRPQALPPVPTGAGDPAGAGGWAAGAADYRLAPPPVPNPAPPGQFPGEDPARGFTAAGALGLALDRDDEGELRDGR
ncbi:hypothetical protein [Streptacidiphilus monticola]|uniref:CobQ/CobB/MinD/ParA nucleotide binding domain-containing protein n=1 Tax=Streptacidiphilus monticola TaxID=2161674 RepID=A0ABW1G9D0_9ACTN